MGPRNTRKDAKGDERCGLGGPSHIARPGLRRGRDALPARSGVACPKTVQRQYLTCPSELVLHLFASFGPCVYIVFDFLPFGSTVRPSSQESFYVTASQFERRQHHRGETERFEAI